ncbi:hypothetical protein [Tuanshanicoccus lijuaniae]|uniref:hypothetical protein n=1 Tax=Aerococcaceae bacterium zg-1292 TaxID=2774330 RepID=UPI001BD8D30D|nr:hypothetical protein [Aerococcaceae bacterium zg-A91]MBS4458348.1 hypothetical protein [Aerococcaceae bacterium zg-BR33]
MAIRKILSALLGILLVFGLFLFWKIYQDSTRIIIPISELQNVSVKREGSDYAIRGTADIGNFERVSNYQARQIEQDVYLYFMKIKSMAKDANIDLKLSKIIVGDIGEPIKNIF